MNNTSIKFAFKIAEYKLLGNDVKTALIMAAILFKRDIKAIRITKRKEGGIRSYLFSDRTVCTYNINGDY